jgi:hypothetical protein
LFSLGRVTTMESVVLVIVSPGICVRKCHVQPVSTIDWLQLDVDVFSDSHLTDAAV